MMNRRKRVAVQLVAMCVLCSLVQRVTHPAANTRVLREPDICKVVFVRHLEPASCHVMARMSAAPTEPCRWDINVVSEKKPEVHRISRVGSDKYTEKEVMLLRELDGCDSSAECKNESLPCVYGIEDPSDALWLRKYQDGSKFVVIFRVGIASLLFFLVSVISDGSIFYPHRPGSFSFLSASLFAILACAALLYLLIVPRKYQLALYGGGFWQSMGYIFIILMIAGALPGVAIIWVGFCLFVIYFLGFMVEQLLCMIAGILYYLGALSVYQAENTLFHLSLIYYRNLEEEAELDRRLLQMSERFLRRVRGNVFLYRVPAALEQDGIQVVENTLPDQLFDEMLQESIPHVDFETLEDIDENSTSQSNARTPLLQQNSAP